VNKITKKFLNSFRAGESGFTLIELLIVIAILGILAAVIIPNVSKFVGSSKVAAANQELAQVGTAAQAVASDLNGSIPFAVGTGYYLDQADLATAITSGSNTSNFSTYITGKLTGGYWISASGAVDMATGKLTTVALVTAGTPCDPTYPALYFNETTGQFQSTGPASGTVLGPGAVPSP
jgi:type IV pilus assembly protein PilA